MLALQEEKLELLKRLRELEQSSRSLLQQRLETLHQLQGLLLREKVDTLRQLQKTLEQERAGRSVRLEHLPGQPGQPAGRGRAGPSPAVETPSLCQHQPLPSSFPGRDPSPAAGGSCPPSHSHALHILRGLREHIQRRLRAWQRVEGALGPAGQRKEEGGQRQRPEQPRRDEAPAPGALRERLLQGKASGPAPELPPCKAAVGAQELQLEKTQHVGKLSVLGAEPGTTAREEVPRQPGTLTPCHNLSPGMDPNEEELQNSTEDHAKDRPAWWEWSCRGAGTPGLVSDLETSGRSHHHPRSVSWNQ